MSVGAKVLCMLGTWAVALIPFWLYLLARFLFNPEGFWENLVLAGIGLYIMGTIQFFMFCFGLAITIAIIEE